MCYTKNNILRLALICVLLMMVACRPAKWQLTAIQSSQYVMHADSLGVDSMMMTWLAPYRDSLDSYTNAPIILSQSPLSKGQPSSALGNLLADLVLDAGRREFGEVQIAMLNYGGIRAALPADTVRRGHVMEMLPFANTLQLVVMSGELLQVFLDHWASKGGTPMAGLTFRIADSKATEVLVGGSVLKPAALYEVVMPDYVANGGDGCGFLAAATLHQPGTTLLFDAVLNGLIKMNSQGQVLKSIEDGRIYR
jgi:2',3'-cyclic-nucleotide 2'-phosphodiesterase (5'-nucleotidase family)